jgi:type VI secretion system protein ImpE
LAEAEEKRPHCAGQCDGAAFDDFRDLDDLTASFLEVLTSNGKYYWIPLERLISLELDAPQTIHDLLWRTGRIAVRNGPEGTVYLPALYRSSFSDSDEAIRLGRKTDWRGGEGTPVAGFGQREFLLGDQTRPIMEIKQLVMDTPSAP